MKLEVNTVIGERPNQILMRTGQFGVVVSFITYSGISGFGLEIGEHSELAPAVMLSASIALMTGGAAMAYMAEKFKAQATAAAKLEPRTRGEDLFLAYIADHLPVNFDEIETLKFPYDDKKTKAELMKTMTIKRLSSEEKRGTVIFKDGQYINADMTTLGSVN